MFKKNDILFIDAFISHIEYTRFPALISKILVRGCKNPYFMGIFGTELELNCNQIKKTGSL